MLSSKFRYKLALSCIGFFIFASLGLFASTNETPPATSNNDSVLVFHLLQQIREDWQDVPKALSLCSKASEIAGRSKDKRLQMLTYFNIGVDHLEFYRNHSQTLSYLLKALDLSQEIKDSLFIQRCYQAIGNTYSDLFEISMGADDFKDSESNLHKALEINKVLAQKQGFLTVFIANNYTNLSDLYLKNQDDSLSLLYAKEAFVIYTKNDDTGGIKLASSNICKALLLKARKTKNKNDYIISRDFHINHYTTFKLGLYDSKQKFDSLPGSNKFWISFYLHHHYISLAEISAVLNEGQDAFLNLIDKASFYAVASKNIKSHINALKIKSQYFEKIRPEYSLEIKNAILLLQDSAYIIEARKKNETLKAILEFTQVEADNKVKSAELDAEKKQLQIKNILLIISVISILLFCLFSFYLFSLNKKLNAKNKLVSEQKEVIEVKNRQITDSINFSKVIQDEILFSKNNLKTFFKEHFLLYSAKDIVSGDFYFVREIADRLIVGMVDCTGHGTSGAMMTLHANALLQPLFEGSNSSDSSVFMNELNKRVKSGFFATNDFEYSGKFGMDISLLILNKKTNKASFCSTNHPLLIKTENEITEYKPKKSTLAYSTEKYTAFDFDILPGCVFYLFTDGFYDQKGGGSAKKYMYKNFKELLNTNSGLNMNDQLKTLNEAHTKWKGPYRQTDDISVLGFRL